MSEPTGEQTPTTEVVVTPPANDPTTGKPPVIVGEFDQERATRLAENLRGEVAQEKTKREQAEQRLQDVLKALGLGTDGKPDPDKVAGQLTAAQQEQKQAKIELAVYKAAGKAGANADAVLDSRAFMSKVADLDPSSATFADEVERAIKTTIEANPLLKAGETKTQTPPRSGGDFSGAGGTPTAEPKTPADRLRAAYAANGTTS